MSKPEPQQIGMMNIHRSKMRRKMRIGLSGQLPSEEGGESEVERFMLRSSTGFIPHDKNRVIKGDL